MPQFEQLQMVHWSFLRPQAIDLALDGINIATGPNGSGKTSCLDALKLMLGVTELKQRPAEYIFDGGGDPAKRAERAYIKATFANPERDGRPERTFSFYGYGCENALHVTAVCEATRAGVRYGLLAGYRAWGGPNRVFEVDIRGTLDEIGSRWMKLTEWRELVTRAGVSKALLGVIGIKQGETDKAIEGTPQELLKKILELTGRQATLDEFRAAKAELAAAREEHTRVSRRLELEKERLRTLAHDVRHHREYIAASARLQRIETLELPAAERSELEEKAEAASRERDSRGQTVRERSGRLDELRELLPTLEEELTAVDHELALLKVAEQEVRDGLVEASKREALSAQQRDKAAKTIADAQALAELTEAAADEAEEQATAEELRQREAEQESAQLGFERSELAAGRPVAPPGLLEFRDALREAGIESELVAEQIEAPHGLAAEAALHDGVWALVVPPGRLDEAVALAVDRGYRLPLAAAGTGEPTGALAGASGLPAAGAFLAELDLPLGSPGVSSDGVVRGHAWAAYRAPERPVLGQGAREQALAAIKMRLANLETELAGLRETATAARAGATLLRAGLVAAVALPELERALAEATRQRATADASATAASDRARELGPRSGELGEQMRALTKERDELDRVLPDLRRLHEAAVRANQELERQLAGLPQLSDEQQALRESVARAEVLRERAAELASQVADEELYPLDIRNDIVLAQHDAQEQTVRESELMLTGRDEDLERVEREVERARERYDLHLRDLVRHLNRRFREICAEAEIEGEVELLAPAAGDDEYGLDVSVAHEPGERPRSYQSRTHSGGQRAKISILVLLAAMSIEGAGSADLLIMDEHVAHLDSNNIDKVAEALSALKQHVQFFLAVPTTAEAGRADWADHQLVFYRREPGEPYAPPIRAMTRMAEDDERYAEMGQLGLTV